MNPISSDKLQRSMETAVEHTDPSEDLVLYSRTSCFACIRTKHLLQESGVSYVEKNLTIMDDNDATSSTLKQNVIAPTLVLGGQAVTGFYPEKIKALLKN